MGVKTQKCISQEPGRYVFGLSRSIAYMYFPIENQQHQTSALWRTHIHVCTHTNRHMYTPVYIEKPRRRLTIGHWFWNLNSGSSALEASNFSCRGFSLTLLYNTLLHSQLIVIHCLSWLFRVQLYRMYLINVAVSSS